MVHQVGGEGEYRTARLQSQQRANIKAIRDEIQSIIGMRSPSSLRTALEQEGVFLGRSAITAMMSPHGCYRRYNIFSNDVLRGLEGLGGGPRPRLRELIARQIEVRSELQRRERWQRKPKDTASPIQS